MRRAGKDDVEAVNALTVRAYAPYTEAFGAPPIPVTEDYAPRIEKGEVWLWRMTARSSAWSCSRTSRRASLIFSIAVTPERQSQGIGQRLLAFAEEEAPTRGYRTLLALYTNARMTRNIEIYRAFGFEEIGRPLESQAAGLDSSSTWKNISRRRDEPEVRIDMRYLPHTDQDRADMLARIGVGVDRRRSSPTSRKRSG